MASPQKENGYTPIAHELMEALGKACLLGSEYQVVIFILRKTYGWGKKYDRISLTQFEQGTDLSRPTIVKTLKNLLIKNLIVKTPLPKMGIVFGFNKNYETWIVKASLLVKSKGVYSKHALTETSKHALTHKRNKIKQKGINIKRYRPESIKGLLH